MIRLFLEKNSLVVDISSAGTSSFQLAVPIIKKHKFEFNPRNKFWYGPWYEFESIKNDLEDIDSVESLVSDKDLEDIVTGTPEQIKEPVRRIFNPNLMNFPPIQGKHPNENFQRDLITKGLNFSRYFYALGMGSGKSYIASAIIKHRVFEFNNASKVLLLTTSIGVRNLYYELLKFIKGLKEEDIFIADKDHRNPFDSDNKASIVICSYNSFRLVCNHYKEELKIKSKSPKKPFLPLNDWCKGDCILVLDESHEVASTDSQRSQLLTLHTYFFKYRYLFSGTPADKPEKLYNQYKILDPWLVYNLSFTQWKGKMAELGDRFSPYAIKEWKKEELEKQNKRFLKSHGIYMRTTDLVDLPNYNEKKIFLNMSPKHREIYEGVVTSLLPNYSDAREIINNFPFLSLSLDNPFLLEKHESRFSDKLNKKINTFHENYLEKLKALDDIISDHPDEKILVWAIHPSTIKMICKRYPKLNPIGITGETEQDERFNLVEQFKKNDNNRLLVANITCLNTSVTILECKVQVYIERAYNYSTYSQSTQRIYRIGQKSDITTYIIIYNNSLDCLLDKNLDSKGTLVDGLMNKDFISQDEWVKIFNFKETDNF